MKSAAAGNNSAGGRNTDTAVRTPSILLRCILSVAVLLCAGNSLFAADMVVVPGGVFRPFYTNDGPVNVSSFRLDIMPVTNRDYLEFLKENSEWTRSSIPKLFADEHYLVHWESDLNPGVQAPLQSPVTQISWFAARAFAEWKGKRLPMMAEWEYAAMSDPVDDDERSTAQRLIAWYSRPAQLPLPSVGTVFENTFGVWDMHGLVWEWVEDYNAVAVSSRTDSTDDPNSRSFCGGGAVGIDDVNNYAAFMRYAFRSSLSPRYTVSQLGFRCAADLEVDHDAE